MQQQITDSILNPTTGTAVTIPVALANALTTNLPIVINIATIIYLTLLISHKSWQMYKEWKEKKNPSS